jgi:hypothetical protein
MLPPKASTPIPIVLCLLAANHTATPGCNDTVLCQGADSPLSRWQTEFDLAVSPHWPERSVLNQDRSAGAARDRMGPEPRLVRTGPHATRNRWSAADTRVDGRHTEIAYHRGRLRPGGVVQGDGGFESPRPSCREASGLLPTRQLVTEDEPHPPVEVGTVAAGCEPGHPCRPNSLDSPSHIAI